MLGRLNTLIVRKPSLLDVEQQPHARDQDVGLDLWWIATSDECGTHDFHQQTCFELLICLNRGIAACARMPLDPPVNT